MCFAANWAGSGGTGSGSPVPADGGPGIAGTAGMADTEFPPSLCAPDFLHKPRKFFTDTIEPLRGRCAPPVDTLENEFWSNSESAENLLLIFA